MFYNYKIYKVWRNLLLQSYASPWIENKATASTALIENIYRSLGQRLDKYPESRCTSNQRCIDLVKERNSVYARVRIIDY